jgi:hypothetical protein
MEGGKHITQLCMAQQKKRDLHIGFRFLQEAGPFEPNQVLFLTFAHQHKKIPTTQISTNLETMIVTFYPFCFEQARNGRHGQGTKK